MTNPSEQRGRKKSGDRTARSAARRPGGRVARRITRLVARRLIRAQRTSQDGLVTEVVALTLSTAAIIVPRCRPRFYARGVSAGSGCARAAAVLRDGFLRRGDDAQACGRGDSASHAAVSLGGGERGMCAPLRATPEDVVLLAGRVFAAVILLLREEACSRGQ